MRKAVCLGTAVLVTALTVWSQGAPLLTFEIASVKPSATSCGPDGRCPVMIRFMPGGGLRVLGGNLRLLIGQAYNVQNFQITGGPVWMNTDRFDIEAKASTSEPEDNTPFDFGKMTDEQRKTYTDKLNERIRNLLADRFQLVIHRETKEQQVYALVVAKNGPKLEEAKTDRPGMRMGRGLLNAQGVEMAMVATSLSNQLGRPVIDKTGLNGKFDFELKWTPDPSQGPAPPPPPPGVQAPPPPDPNGPSIFTAVQEQLGLRLESQKGPVEILVIDRAEKPSEN